MSKVIKKFKNVTCKYCGWVHFEVTREYAKNQVKTFNKYYDSLSEEKQQEYYGGNKSFIRTYERCMFCGTCYHNMRKYKKGDSPMGCTLNPIITRRKWRHI
jgi:NADH pyrophosphatase NudC (nudix superfamily)